MPRKLLIIALGLQLLLLLALGGATALADSRERSPAAGATRVERELRREHDDDDDDEHFERARASLTRRAPDVSNRSNASTTQLGLDSAAPVDPVVADSLMTTTNPASSNPFFWYLARASGLTAYLLLFLNVVLGLAVRDGTLDARLPRWRTFDLHQFTALLAMALLGLHGGALMADRYVRFTLVDLLVPLAAPYRPLWTALGILAFYLMLVLLVSSYLRQRVGQRTWRAIHYLGFVAFALALGHGVLAGTDTGAIWAEALYWSTGMTVLLLTLRRFFLQSGQPKVQTGRGRGSTTAPAPGRGVTWARSAPGVAGPHGDLA